MVEELGKGASAEFLEDLHEILGNHGFILVSLEIGLHAFAEEVFPEFGAQHVENPAPLRVGPEAELL